MLSWYLSGNDGCEMSAGLVQVNRSSGGELIIHGEMSGVGVKIPTQDYESLHAAVVICGPLVHTETACDRLYTISSASRGNKSGISISAPSSTWTSRWSNNYFDDEEQIANYAMTSDYCKSYKPWAPVKVQNMRVMIHRSHKSSALVLNLNLVHYFLTECSVSL